MPKLEVKENKKLLLKNVLKRELKNIDVTDFYKGLENFKKELQLLRVQIFGPLIVKIGGTNISENGKITTNYDFFI